MAIRFRLSTRARWAPVLGIVVGLLLAGCGSEDAETSCPPAPMWVARTTAGPTPFIALVGLEGLGVGRAESYRFTILPKNGAASRPVDVSYAPAALARGGYVEASGDAVTVPVFGLYAGRANRVALTVRYSASCAQTLETIVNAPAYADVAGVLTRPTVLKARVPSANLGFDYFLMKTRADGPVIVDTDGEVRWVPPQALNGFSSAWHENALIVGSNNSTAFRRIELDGRVEVRTLAVAHYTAFHHNLEAGKVGLLGEMDGVSNGVPNIESLLAEFTPTGELVKEWDMATLFSNHMRERGDDPSLFVRPGIDWFHMNTAIYDPRDDTLIVSSRESFVVKISYQSGQIIWILGDPTKYWYSFPSLRAKALQLEAGGLYPIGQHALSLTADGQLMLFNNGAPSFFNPSGTPAGESRDYSAVSTYVIDPVAMTARESRRFDHDRSVLSDVCSSAYEAPQGSMLLNYAAASGRTRARLIGLDAARQIVFDFEYPSPQTCATSWNAVVVPLESLNLR